MSPWDYRQVSDDQLLCPTAPVSVAILQLSRMKLVTT